MRTAAPPVLRFEPGSELRLSLIVPVLDCASGSRCIKSNRTSAQGLKKQWVSDSAKCDHVDGAFEDRSEIFA